LSFPAWTYRSQMSFIDGSFGRLKESIFREGPKAMLNHRLSLQITTRIQFADPLQRGIPRHFDESNVLNALDWTPLGMLWTQTDFVLWKMNTINVRAAMDPEFAMRFVPETMSVAEARAAVAIHMIL
jgi:hypothetical protein